MDSLIYYCCFDVDYRLGECFTKVENMMCMNRLLGVKCTKVACCATVGKAWGVPCRLCPKNLRMSSLLLHFLYPSVDHLIKANDRALTQKLLSLNGLSMQGHC